MYQVFLSENDLILDNDRKVIPGAKIECFDPTSNTSIDIYTYDSANDDYVPADNPIYIGALSRPDHTYFCDRLVLCRLYKYLGNFSDPMIDDDTENWEFVREWLGAYNAVSSGTTEGTTYGLSGLLGTDPEIGTVTVVGYWNENDCEARQYVWDPTSVASADGGYIVKNPDIDTGRWILKFDGEYLPSTYYGVYPGREANMNALLGYVDSIGTQKTAPGVYFVRGTYDGSTSPITTNKKILVDCDTKFTRDYFSCYDVQVVGDPTSWICDFYVTRPDTVVHSSWFKSVTRFLTSGAKKLIIDNNNFFTNSVLSGQTVVENATIYGRSRLPITYSTASYLDLRNCTIVGREIFSPSTDYVKFTNMNITDRWWTSLNANQWSIGTINNGDRIEAKTAAMNTIVIRNFNSPGIYLKFITANGNTDINMEGATISKLDSDYNASVIRKLRNCTITGNLHLYPGQNLQLFNVRVEGYVDSSSLTGSNTLNAYNCYLNFYNEANLTVFATQSSIYNQQQFSGGLMTFDLTDCEDVSLSLNYASDNTAHTPVQKFRNCNLRNCTMILKEGHFYECYIDGGTYKFYPYKSGNDFYLKSTFSGCTINMSNAIEYNKFYNTTDASDCYGMWSENKWVGNNFCGSNANGITMPLWAEAARELLFIRATNHPNHICSGNVGRCPKEKPAGMFLSSWSDGTIYGRSDHPEVKKMNLSTRAFPNLNDGYSGTFISKFVQYACPIDPSSGYNFTHWGIFSIADDADFFAIGLYASSALGNVKIA